MAKGLPKSIIKKYGITKKAWRVFRGQKSKKKSTKKSTTSRTKSRSVRKVARRGINSQTVFKYARLFSLLAPFVPVLFENRPASGKARIIGRRLSGYDYGDGTFSMKYLAKGWTPFIVTSLVTALIPKITGMIRRL